MVETQAKIDAAPEATLDDAATRSTGETAPETAQPEATETAPEPKKKKRGGHLHQIDFVRLFTFGGVILDHVILGLAPITALTAQGVGLMLRYTRYCFFALTGFVLTYQYRNREMHAPTFWRRRYKLIGLPFLVWSLFYWLNRHYQRGGLDAIWDIFKDGTSERLALKSLAYDLITGNAAYHLYFLSVSMQIYLVFPAVLWVIKRTWGYHRYLLAASGVFHIVLLYGMVRPPLAFFDTGAPGLIWRYLGVTLFPYQFFILAGCLAAYHFEAFGAFLRRFRGILVGLSLATIVLTLIYFVIKANAVVVKVGPLVINDGAPEEMFRATNVFMVHNAFMFVAIIILLYICGTIWQNRRHPGSTPDRIIQTAADRSFGIYLGHVIVLSTILPISREHLDAPLWVNLLATYAATVVVTIFLAEVLRRSPISLITTGRERLDWRTQRWGRSSFVAVLGAGVGFAIYETIGTELGLLITAISGLLLLSAIVVGVKQSNAAHDAKPVKN